MINIIKLKFERQDLFDKYINNDDFFAKYTGIIKSKGDDYIQITDNVLNNDESSSRFLALEFILNNLKEKAELNQCKLGIIYNSGVPSFPTYLLHNNEGIKYSPICEVIDVTKEED